MRPKVDASKPPKRRIPFAESLRNNERELRDVIIPLWARQYLEREREALLMKVREIERMLGLQSK